MIFAVFEVIQLHKIKLLYIFFYERNRDPRYVLVLPEGVLVFETLTFVGDFWPSTTILTESATVTVLPVWTTLTESSSAGAIFSLA